jgi:hypothetical protein
VLGDMAEIRVAADGAIDALDRANANNVVVVASCACMYVSVMMMLAVP